MAKAIFTASDSTTYDDRKDLWYHFPKTYLAQVEAARGDDVIFYQPRRNSGPGSSDGSQSYIAAARITGIRSDPSIPDHYFADLSHYIDFDTKVPFKLDYRYFESALQKLDGTTNKGAFGRSVRLVPDDEFDAIIAMGLHKSLSEVAAGGNDGFDLDWNDEQVIERPRTPVLLMRRVRAVAFRRNVLAAYNDTCAVTGLRILDSSGRAEAQAAHIRSVAKDGPDAVRNGVALTGTAHWLFDRGFISINDDYSLLVSREAISIAETIGVGPRLLLPHDASNAPRVDFIRWHREEVYCG
ncbi:HNH endonuclease [Stenotrophomonas nematodicola]|uniref:HNH endonuclease n=1 Tax=Stenotrophomonas nematodicola TaxID=2656746 RepID=UPI003D9A7FA7